MKSIFNIFHSSMSSVFFMTVLLVSCKMSDEINIEIPPQKKNFVIEGYLTPDSPVEITVLNNNLMDNELIINPVWNAKAYITDRQDTLDLLNIIGRNKNRNLLINYRTDSLPGALKGDILYLSVITRDNDTITGKTVIVSPIRIENAVIENNYLILRQLITDNKFTGYLRTDLTAYRSDTIFSASSKFIDLSGAESLDISLMLPERILQSDSLLVRSFHITRDYYNYYVTLNDDVNAYYDPFLTPSGIKSNICNGLGIFTYYTKDEKMIHLKK